MKRSTAIKLVAYPLGILVLLMAITVGMTFIPMTEYVAGEGYVTTDAAAQVRPRDEGPIKEILVSYGQRVTQGQVLFVLEDATEQATLQKAEAALLKAKAVAQTAEAELQEARERLKLLEARQARQESTRIARENTLNEELRRARNELTRIEKLGATGTVSEQILDEMRSKVAVSLAEIEEVRATRSADLDQRDRDVAQAQIAVAESTYQQYQAEVKQYEAEVVQRQAELERRRIRSPLDGVILKNAFVVGEVVERKQILGEVFDDSEWIVKAQFRERLVRKLVSPDTKQRRTALIELPAYPRSPFGYLRGRVKYDPKVVTPQRTGDGVVLLYFAIESYDQGDGGLWRKRFIPGQSAQVYVEAGPTNLLYWLLGIDSQ